MKKIIAIAIPGLFLASAAMAAGPVAPVMEPMVAPMEAVPVYVAPMTPDWTGFYVGAQLGYAGLKAKDDQSDISLDGSVYGLHVGYNYDLGNNVVMGVELAYSGSSIDDDGIELKNMTQLKLKAGYTVGQSMIYGTGGYAHAKLGTDQGNRSDDGYVIGLGVDYMLNQSWIVSAEVLYNDFDNFDGTGVDVDGTSLTLKASYRF